MEPEEIVLDSIPDICVNVPEPAFRPVQSKSDWQRTICDINNQLTIVWVATETVHSQLKQGSGAECQSECCQDLMSVLNATQRLVNIMAGLAQIGDRPANLPIDVPQTRSSPATQTILVVDDEERLRVLCTKLLAARGYKVLEAWSGEQAVQISANHQGPIDLLITDFELDKFKEPKFTGRQLCDALRPSRPEMRVLYISGIPERSVRNDAGGIGSEANFLQKPFERKILPGVVERILAEDTVPSA